METVERAPRPDMPPKETCYCCQMLIKRGEAIYRLKDEYGLMFFAHKTCAERDMALVNRG